MKMHPVIASALADYRRRGGPWHDGYLVDFIEIDRPAAVAVCPDLLARYEGGEGSIGPAILCRIDEARFEAAVGAIEAADAWPTSAEKLDTSGPASERVGGLGEKRARGTFYEVLPRDDSPFAATVAKMVLAMIMTQASPRPHSQGYALHVAAWSEDLAFPAVPLPRKYTKMVVDDAGADVRPATDYDDPRCMRIVRRYGDAQAA